MLNRFEKNFLDKIMNPHPDKKIIDAHVHLNMKDINPFNALKANLASCKIEEAVLILNSQKEKEYFLDHFQEVAEDRHHWHIGVLIDLNSGALETDIMNRLLSRSIPFSIKVHPRFSGLCISDIPSLIKKIDEMPRSWENIIVDGFYYGSHLEHQIAMELAIAFSRHYEDKRIIYAHAGGIHILKTLVHLRDRGNICYDYSLSCNYLLDSSLKTDFVLFLKHNKQKVMFGSDYPDFSSENAVRATQTLCEAAMLSPDEQADVFYHNAKRLYSFS